MDVQQLTRVFKMGSVRLPDPDSSLSPEAVLGLYSASYPHLAHSTLDSGVVENDELVYSVIKPPVKTKG